MKCEIAKNNPLLMDQAIEHYLNNKTTFTFMSLWNDEEPYSKDELLKCLKVRIDKVKLLFEALPTVENKITLVRLQKAFNKLKR